MQLLFITLAAAKTEVLGDSQTRLFLFSIKDLEWILFCIIAVESNKRLSVMFTILMTPIY